MVAGFFAFSSVLDSGGKEEFAETKSIYGVGGSYSVDFWFFTQPISMEGDVDRLPLAHALLGYTNAWGNLAGDRSYDGQFTAKGDIYLGSSNITLSATYVNGEMPYSSEKVENLTVGLGVLLNTF